MASSGRESELRLVAGLMAGRAEFVAHFVDVAASPIWAAVVLIEGEGERGEKAFSRVLTAIKADNYCLMRAFDGRSELATFLKLLARQILIDEIAQSFAASHPDWMRFERAFGRDIRKRVSRRFPRDPASHDDVYQEISLRLAEESFKRLRGFDGRGRFEAYVFVLVERLLIDLMRKESSRRRLPAAVQAMPELEKAIFIQIAWTGTPPEARKLHAALAHKFGLSDESETATALERVRPAIDKVKSGSLNRETSLDDVLADGISLVDGAPDPEQALAAQEAEEARAEFVAAIKAEAERMPPDERAYLTLVLSNGEVLPPREVAKRMTRPVEEVRIIQARVLRRLRNLPAAGKFASMSVSTGNEERFGP
jgi:RNA polymerase primary sigma factor